MIITIEQHGNFYIVQFTRLGEPPIRKYASTEAAVDHLIKLHG